MIRFVLPRREHVTVKVFDLSGKEIATLVNDTVESGEHAFAFDGQNLVSGVYFYSMQAGEFRQIRKSILLK